jgi:leader peptidase (prepilin peptidase) / N-methyltransferase
MAARLIIAAVLALPAGWFAGLLADRVPPMGRDADNNLRDPGALKLLERPLEVRLGGRELWIQVAVVVAYVASAYRLRDEPALLMVPYFVWWCPLVALSATDMEHRRLPDRIVLPSFVIGVAVMVVVAVVTGRAVSIRYALIAAGVYFGLFLVLNLIHPALAAFGDVKTAGLIGLTVGFVAYDTTDALLLSMWAIFLAFVMSAVFGFVFIAFGGGLRRARQRRIGLGSYLVAAAFVVFLLSPALVGS